MRVVQYSIPINMLHDTPDAIATKRQYAKRQAFAALNTELADDTTYVLHTSQKWVAVSDPLGLDEMPIFGRGDGTYTYTITYQAWSEEQ